MHMQVQFDDEQIVIDGTSLPRIEYQRTGGEELEHDIDAALRSVGLVRVSPLTITDDVLTGAELDRLMITARDTDAIADA